MKYASLAALPTTAYLHFDANRVSDNEVQVDYELVIPLEGADCRGIFDRKGRKTRPKSHRIIWLDAVNSKRIPLGRTKVGTSNLSYPFNSGSAWEGHIDIPFRDGAHCWWDNQKLGNLPLVYTKDGLHYTLIVEPRE